MQNKKFSLKNTFIPITLIFLTLFFVFILIPIEIQSYFGGGSFLGLNPFISASSHIYGTAGISNLPLSNIWGGLYGPGMLEGLSGSYGRLFGLYGVGLGMYGSLYGGGLGLYGGGIGLYGSLYGSGIGEYSGLYGSTIGMYGGLYGSGLGLYGALYGSGIGLYGGVYGMNPGLYGVSSGLGISALTNPVFTAQQVGTWTGTWTNFTISGLMTLNLAEDILTGALYGYAQLLGNIYLSALINVTGTVLNNQIFVSGSGIGLGNQKFTCEIIGILTSATTMIGSYNMINTSSGGNVVEQGAINLELITPVI